MTAEPISGGGESASRGAVPRPSGHGGEGAAPTDGFLAITRFGRRYGGWVIGVPVVFALLALIVQLWVARPLHEASVVITIGPAPSSKGFSPPKMSPAMYLQLARSAGVLENAGRELRRAGIFPGGTEMARDQLRAELGKPTRGDEADTALLILTYWADTEAHAAEAVNAWARVLLDLDRTQVYRAALRWARSEAEADQRKLTDRADRISSRLAATRAVLDSAPQGLRLTGRRLGEDVDGGGEAEPERPYSLSREDRITVSAELAMRVAEAEIDLQVINPGKKAVDERSASLTELSDRIDSEELDILNLLEEDTTGLFGQVRTRAELLQPARGSIEPPSRRIAFKTVLAALAGLLLVLAAAALREAVPRRFA